MAGTAISDGIAPISRLVGKRAIARRSTGSRAKVLCGLRKVTEVLRDTSLRVILELKTGKVPALVDNGAQLSCIRSDIAEFLYLREKTCAFSSCSLSYLLVDRQQCEVTDAGKLQVKLLSFRGTMNLKLLRGGPFPAILGLDFMGRTRILVKVASRVFSFDFAPNCSGTFLWKIRMSVMKCTCSTCVRKR